MKTSFTRVHGKKSGEKATPSTRGKAKEQLVRPILSPITNKQVKKMFGNTVKNNKTIKVRTMENGQEVKAETGVEVACDIEAIMQRLASLENSHEQLLQEKEGTAVRLINLANSNKNLESSNKNLENNNKNLANRVDNLENRVGTLEEVLQVRVAPRIAALKSHHSKMKAATCDLPNEEQQKAVLTELLAKSNTEVATTERHIFFSG